MPNVFAAIAPDAGPIGANLLSACKPGSVAVTSIQGSVDPLSPIDGGQVGGAMIASAVQSMQLWAATDGCSATPTITHPTPAVNDGTNVDVYTFAGCRAGTDVIYYVVEGMGHAWPPYISASVSVTGPNSANINATDVFWNFFSTHSRASMLQQTQE